MTGSALRIPLHPLIFPESPFVGLAILTREYGKPIFVRGIAGRIEDLKTSPGGGCQVLNKRLDADDRHRLVNGRGGVKD